VLLCGMGQHWVLRLASVSMHDKLAGMRPHSREKTGRNDPCPCGSGKKYKQCCLRSSEAQAVSTETPWSRQREASDRLTPALLKVAVREFGDDMLLAWADFNQVAVPEPLEEFPNEEAIFSPYFLFEWNPDAAPRRSGKPRAGAVASIYLEKYAQRLSDLEALILEQAISRPVSFYEVVRCNPGHSAVLRDVLIGEEIEVEEHSGTKTMRPGSLLYAQVWILPEVATLGRLAPCVIPPERKADIVGLRSKLQRKIAKKNRALSASDLLHYSEIIRTVYLDIRDALRTPRKLANTDGEPFVLHTLTFRVGSAQLAFDALASLALGATKKDLLEAAEWNADGSLRSVEFPWLKRGNKLHKTWENTVLGNLKISGRTLTVEVNSAKRAEMIRQQVEKRLGLHAVHISTTTTTPEELMAKQGKQAESVTRKPATAAPQIDPEMQKRFASEMQEEVEAWIHKKVPALGGRTPLQAVADPDGREVVESLLLGWERHFEGPPMPGGFRPDIDAIRRLLKLPVAIGTVIH